MDLTDEQLEAAAVAAERWDRSFGHCAIEWFDSRRLQWRDDCYDGDEAVIDRQFALEHG